MGIHTFRYLQALHYPYQLRQRAIVRFDSHAQLYHYGSTYCMYLLPRWWPRACSGRYPVVPDHVPYSVLRSTENWFPLYFQHRPTHESFMVKGREARRGPPPGLECIRQRYPRLCPSQLPAESPPAWTGAPSSHSQLIVAVGTPTMIAV
jgi:hypothetical protein